MYINALSQCHGALCNHIQRLARYYKNLSRVVVLCFVKSSTGCSSHYTAAAVVLLGHVRILLFVYLAPDRWYHVVAGRVTVVDEAVEGY